MTEEQFKILNERLIRIEELLNKPKKKRQTKITEVLPLEEQIKPFECKYSPAMIKDFILYWSEEDRWKKQKVFDISKRLERWKRQQEKWQHEKEARQQVKQTVELPQENRSNVSSGFSKLDFSKYTKNQEIKDITN